MPRKSIKIYTGAFRIPPIEALHVETNEPPQTWKEMYWEWGSCINWEAIQYILSHIITQHPPWLLKNITYWYEGEKAPNNCGKHMLPAA